MSSTIMDFFVEKITSLSAKMKGDSSKFSGPSYLMSVNSNSLPHLWSQVDLFNGLIGYAFIKEEEISNQIVPLKQHFGYLTSNYSFSFRNTERPFLHPLNNLAMDIHRHSHSFLDSPMDIRRHSHSLPDSRFLPNDTLLRQLVKSFCNNFSEMNRNQKSEVKMPKPSPPLQTEINMAVSEIHSPAKKKCELTNKSTVPNTLTLNKELANRKTKEMHKRSKKRRRRQKKSRQLDNCSASISDDDVDGSIPASVTSVCVVSDDVDFGCTVALSHSLKMAPKILSSFVVSVISATDDDESEWESSETDQVDSSCQKSDSSFVSHLPLPKSSECSQPVNCSSPKATSFLSSFILPVEGSTDDESDWDSCDAEIFPETSEFEFTGLFVPSLCTSQTHLVDPNCSINNTSEDDETIKLRIHLQEVNKTWNKSVEGLDNKPKLPSKVSFAPDETLAEVFPVEMYERKGEWEMHAIERLRFKRKIDELEKILSPCFHPDHRSKIFNKIAETVL